MIKIHLGTALALFAISLLLSTSACALICDATEAKGFFHWPEQAIGEGTISIEPEGPIVAGTAATFTVTYTAGGNGLPVGASVELVTPRGCAAPRAGVKSGNSILSASSGGNPVELKLVPKKGRRFPGHRVAAILPDGLEPGARVVFTWERAAIVREINSLNDSFLEFFVLERPNPQGDAVLLPKMAKLRLLPQEAVALDVFASSIVAVGEPARATVRARDEFGNPAISYRGTILLSATDESSTEVVEYKFSESDRGAHTFGDITFLNSGVKYLRVADDAAEMSAVSNPIEVSETPPDLHLYWADIHVHTVMSWDAWFGAQSVVTYGGAFQMGRDFAGLDFQANTDHNAPHPYTEKEWPGMVATTNSFNDPGRFVTLVAIENSGPTGDKNVYWRGGSAPYMTAEKRDPIALFNKLKGQECLIIPHHVAQSMRPTDWRPEYFEPEKERLLEIYSNHGRAEFYGNMPHFSHHPEPTMKGYTYQDALARGYRLGVVAASDEHRGKVGSVGLTAVWAPELTREAIYDAMKARRCYGTTNPRIIVRFSANDHQMGEEFMSSGPVRIEGSAVGSAKLLSIEVIKNGRIAHVAYPQKIKAWDHGEAARRLHFQWDDEDFTEDAYYYLRVTQAPDSTREGKWNFPPQMDFAWSSPVWVTYEPALQD